MAEQMCIEIPKDVENLRLPLPELLNFYKDAEDRIIWIEEIDDNLLDFMKLILRWNKEDIGVPVENRKPIRIFIYSYGGEIDVCFSFIYLVKLSKTPIHTINIGVAASAGALIFLSGHKRFAMNGSTILLHQGSGALNGTAGQIMDMSNAYGKILEKMKNYILENTEISKNTYTRMKDKEWTITSDEFVKFGIADEILIDIDIILQ